MPFWFVTMATKADSFRQLSIYMGMPVTWDIDYKMQLVCFIRCNAIYWWWTIAVTVYRLVHRSNVDCTMMHGLQSIIYLHDTIWIWIKSSCSVDRWVVRWLLMLVRIRNIIRNWCALYWRIHSPAYRTWPFRWSISRLDIFRIWCSKIWWESNFFALGFVSGVNQKNFPRLHHQYLSIHKIQYFAAPCLFVSGMADTLVPPKMMTQLHARCGSTRKQLLQINGGTHNETWATTGWVFWLTKLIFLTKRNETKPSNRSPSYYQGLAQFLIECKETRGPLQTPPVLRSKWPQIEEV